MSFDYELFNYTPEMVSKFSNFKQVTYPTISRIDKEVIVWWDQLRSYVVPIGHETNISVVILFNNIDACIKETENLLASGINVDYRITLSAGDDITKAKWLVPLLTKLTDEDFTISVDIVEMKLDE